MPVCGFCNNADITQEHVSADWLRKPQHSLEDIALRLAETPIMPLDGACPIDLTRGLFGM